MKKRKRKLGQGLETLERRDLLSAVPFGASSQDTAEFLLGDVTVNVVFLESNGAIDPSTEDWNAELTAEVKANIEEGVNWWVDTLAMYTDVHQLNFNFDYQYADNPIETSYEPISRRSQDFTLWIDDFFRATGQTSSSDFSRSIRNFNHQQRVVHDTNWSFTIFVVNAENDPNDRFGNADASDTEFKRAFAYTGGRFIIMPHSRPPSTVAHELAHIFWAHDEYSGGDPYTARRGYYATQNTNGANGHPDVSSREPSILASTSSPYGNHDISQSARETLGWRDSDGDGIFDVLDVDHAIHGSVTFDAASRTARFVGSSSVQTLPNQNPSGTRNDITLNRITDLQYRFDDGAWQDLVEFDAYQVTLDATTPSAPVGTTSVSFRTIDDRINVTSAIISEPIETGSQFLQNPINQYDVNADTHVAPNDVLTLVRFINAGDFRPTDGPPYYDVSGDGNVSPRDVLMLIQYINAEFANAASQAAAAEPPHDVVAVDNLFAALAAQTDANDEDDEPFLQSDQ